MKKFLLPTLLVSSVILFFVWFKIGPIDINSIKSQVLSATIGTNSKLTYKISPSKNSPGVFRFQYEFLTQKNKEDARYFDVSIAPFDENKAKKELGTNITNFGKIRDAWGYPRRENAFHKGGSVLNTSTLNKLQSLNPFGAKEALASDNDPNVLGLVNCRANTSVTGYFKAYFEDVALSNGVGYAHPTLGQSRRNEVCQVLQDISILIKLNQTNVTPDILFMADPGNIPSNALAAASSYYGYYNVGPDNGSLHKHILSRQDPTPGLGNFDAFIITNFSSNIAWDVDSTLNSNTYDFYTVMYHEVLHTLGFRSALLATITQTNIGRPHTTFDSNLYKDSTLLNKFFSSNINALLQVPVGAPSPWFITNTGVYQGIKNIVNAIPDGVRSVYTPQSWEQGSSLSHFDMNRASTTYVMHPSIVKNTARSIHDHEKETLCHMGYQVLGISGCEKTTPLAVDDSYLISGTQLCIQPLVNDRSFTGGSLSFDHVTPFGLQAGDTLAYYTSPDCTTGLQSGTGSAKSIRITYGSSTAQRRMYYANKDSISNRISFSATITLDPVLACVDDYKYISQWGSYGTGNGQFEWAPGITVDSSGNVYVVDNSSSNPRIQKFTSNGTYITQWGGQGTGNGQFDTPHELAVDSSDNIYITDHGNRRIQKFTSSGTYITQWGIRGAPVGIDIDSFDNVYVSDGDNFRIQKFTSNGTYITQWGGQGTGNGQFVNIPTHVAIDSSNNVYVVDLHGHRVKKFTSNGTYITQWGGQGTGNGQFDYPYGVTVDSFDNVYVSDGNDRIQKFTSSGSYITKWGSSGSGNGEFNNPLGIETDQSGNVYVADNSNQRVQKFNTSCDKCPNISGSQNVVPSGYQIYGGQCVLQGGINEVNGIVYYDQNENGDQDTSESGLDGVEVGLFKQGQNTPIQTTTTKNTPNLGKYIFENVPVGTHYVALIDENLYSKITQPPINSATLIPGYSHAWTVSSASGPVTYYDIDFGVVLATAVPDLCLNLTGLQETIPSGYTQGPNKTCDLIVIGIPVPPRTPDVCPNITGIQTIIPFGYRLDANGECQKSTITPLPLTPLLKDKCPNISGYQFTIPVGFQLNSLGQCEISPTTSDKCVNLPGVQSVIPSGYQLNRIGECELIL